MNQASRNAQQPDTSKPSRVPAKKKEERTEDIREQPENKNIKQPGKPKRKREFGGAEDAKAGAGKTVKAQSQPSRPPKMVASGNTQQPDTSRSSTLPAKRKKERTGDVMGQPGNITLESASKPKRKQTTGEVSDSMSTLQRDDAVQNKPNISEQTTFQPKEKIKLAKPNPSLTEFQPATFTGFTELPIGKAFIILILWIPRFFIPWILAWHQFNVYILSNPWHWKDRQGELHQQKIILLVGKSIIAILCSAIVDLIRRKWEVDFYAYQILLILFTFCPLAGGLVDALLRAGFHDETIYKDWWFTSIALMQWAMSVAFMMFPVQFACIYVQHNNMSRNAHYSWTALFVMLEFVNAYIAFLIIPAPCPTKEWTQIVVWAGLFSLMITVTMLTLIFLFAVKALKYVMLMCCKGKAGVAKPDTGPFVERPLNVKMKKLMWFSIMALPVICSYFTFSVLERFAPFEEWDDHHSLSTLGIFHFFKVIGIIMMVLVMFIVRKILKKRNPSTLKAETIYLGLPHCWCVLALVTMVVRFVTLSHLKEGDIIVGPIPDMDKAVFVFVNVMFRNRTICISSEYFQPVRIRPEQFAVREMYDIINDSFRITMEVDPYLEPAMNESFHINNVRKGEWKVYRMNMQARNHSNVNIRDYYRELRQQRLLDVENLRPKAGPPVMMIFEWELHSPVKDFFHEMNHSSSGTVKVPCTNSLDDESWTYERRNLTLWVVDAIGKWTTRLWNRNYNYSARAIAWIANCSPCVSPLEFEVENNSLYLLTEYNYQEKLVQETIKGEWYAFGPPPRLPQFPMTPGSYVLHKLGEVAGPDSNRLRSNKELQKDWAIKLSMALAGMAAGGIFLGFVYLFWVDPPVPKYRTISLAVCWVLMGVASEIPRIKMINVDVKVSAIFLMLQIIMTTSHFVGAHFMYTSIFNFRTRPD